METWTGEMREEVDHLANTLSTKITQKMVLFQLHIIRRGLSLTSIFFHLGSSR